MTKEQEKPVHIRQFAFRAHDIGEFDPDHDLSVDARSPYDEVVVQATCLNCLALFLAEARNG